MGHAYSITSVRTVRGGGGGRGEEGGGRGGGGGGGGGVKIHIRLQIRTYHYP